VGDFHPSGRTAPQVCFALVFTTFCEVLLGRGGSSSHFFLRKETGIVLFCWLDAKSRDFRDNDLDVAESKDGLVETEGEKWMDGLGFVEVPLWSGFNELSLK
jgi:hypothetical protein